MKRFVPVLLMAVLLTGCNWLRLLEFRSQLRQLPDYTRWENRDYGRLLVFTRPLLGLSDLKGFGFSPARIREDLFSIKYRYAIANTQVEGDTEMIFLMDKGKVSGIVFPKILFEMVGQGNVESFLRLVGGDSSPAADVRAIDKAQVLLAAFGQADPPVDQHRVAISFTPHDKTNMMFKVVFEEGKKRGAYGNLSLLAGKEDGSPSSDRKAK